MFSVTLPNPARTWLGRLRWVTFLLVLSLLASVLAVPDRVALADPTAPALPADRPAVEGTVVGVRDRGTDPAQEAEVTTPPPATWPGAAAAEVDLSTGEGVAVGGLVVQPEPVAPEGARAPGRAGVASAAGTATTGAVRVEVLDPVLSEQAGVEGPLLRLSRTDGGTGAVAARLKVGYADFGNAYGGDFGARMRVVELPSCVVDAPAAEECTTPEDVEASVDPVARTVTATFDVPGAAGTTARSAASAAGGSVFALSGGAESSQGNFGATKLPPSSSWSVAESSGGLNWSYPTRVPPVPGGLAPEISLSYSSQAVDGRTAATNNQGSWIGEGFSYEPGFIERRYRSCRDDGHKKLGDQCWARPNAMLSLGGRSSELVMVDENTWKLASDDGTVVKRLLGATNKDDDGEHWRVTTPDGRQYFFGLNRLPGWGPGNDETNSTWTAPVFGDDDKEPCHEATFADSWCQQGWRWNLDYVKDRFGNVVSFYYEKETNQYALRGKHKVTGTPYDRGGYLRRIDYGQRDGQVYSTPAPARVVFETTERCLPTSTVACEPGDLKKATARHWPDVPFDRNCAAGKKCSIYQSAPTFWTRKRLVEIRTEIRTGNDWSPVDSWRLKHLFTDNGDGSRTLWLSNITHEGRVGGTAALPSVDLYGIQLPNRVAKANDHISPLIRFRLAAVYTDIGGQLDVNYAPADCTAGNLPKPGKSTRRCFPIKWAPSDSLKEPITDWFHKYVVQRTIETDRIAKSPDMVTSYEYLGDAGWRKPAPDGITESKYVTWSEWRGYGNVRVRRGDGQTMTTREDKTFFRGLHGNADPDGGTHDVTVEDAAGEKHTDLNEFMGLEASSVTYDGADVVTKTITKPWRHTTYTQDASWGTRLSTIVRPTSVRKLTALEAGGWRETRQTTTFDTTYGVAKTVDDQGDISITTDDKCTTTSYVSNEDTGVLARVSRMETVAVRCGQPVDRSKQVISDDRTFYDGLGFGAAPTRGYITKVERLATHDGTTAKYETMSESDPDDWGREEWSEDARGVRTTNTYTHTQGLLTAMKVTNAAGWGTTSEYAPAWGTESAKVDPNGRREEVSYDPLGRVTDVWLPDRSKAQKQTPSAKYTYFQRKDLPLAIRTETVDTDGSYVPRFELYDGHGRLRQTQTTGPANGRLLSDTFYTATATGAIAKTNDPYLAVGAPGDRIIEVNDGSVSGQTLHQYDGAGREIAEISSVSGNVRWQTTTRYGGDRVHVDPPTGGTPTTTISTARDTIAELRQYKGDGPSGAHETVTYKYTPAGSLASYTDAAGNAWTNEYDQRNRLVKSTSPDAGTVRTTFDELDRPLVRTGAGNDVTSYEYDDLGRKVAEYRGSGTGRVKTTEWVYDRALKGQLDHTRQFEGTAEYAVAYFERDAFYRPAKTRYIVRNDPDATLNGTYEFGAAFNRDGTAQSVAFPAAGGLPAEAVAYSYDALDRPVGMTGASKYVTPTATRYGNTGSLKQIELSTGAKQAWFTWHHEEGTNRLTKSRIDRQNAPVVDMDATYSYDAAGNVTSIADTPASGERDVQCFRTDGLRRLTEAWTSASTATDACAGGPATTGVGGPAPYHLSYTYDLAGNRDTETRHGIGGAGDTTLDYRYDATEKPHAVRSIVESGPSGTTTMSYDYDSAGNTSSRQVPGRQQELDWDEDNRLRTVTEAGRTTTFVYGPDGSRWLRREPGATTLYLPGMELRLVTASKTVTATRYYTFAGRTVAMRSTTGVFFLGGDHQGTALVAINAVTGTIVRRRTTPFGTERPQAQTGWPNERGFVGGAMDTSIGLVQLGARIYDPGIGRFLSADPVTSPTQPQQMQGYGYADHNPVTLSDPTGRTPSPSPSGSGSNRGGNQSAWHNLAVLISWWMILRVFGMGKDVTADLGPGAKRNSIPRAHRHQEKDKKGEIKPGNADLIMWTEDVVYIWEVKPGNQDGKDAGKPQLAMYMQRMREELARKNDPRQVEPGPALPSMRGVPAVAGGKRIDIWMEPEEYPGLIFYGESGNKRPVPTPKPYPLPVPNPVKVPSTKPVPAPAQSDRGVVPHPGPNGPYGYPAPAYDGLDTSGGRSIHWDPPTASEVGEGAKTAGTFVLLTVACALLCWSPAYG